MTLLWRYRCDGTKCTETIDVAPLIQSPPGWLVRTVIDRVESLDERATGSGFPGGRSELQHVRHYCEVCRRKVTAP